MSLPFTGEIYFLLSGDREEGQNVLTLAVAQVTLIKNNQYVTLVYILVKSLNAEIDFLGGGVGTWNIAQHIFRASFGGA